MVAHRHCKRTQRLNCRSTRRAGPSAGQKMNSFMTLQDALDARAAGPQDLVFINGDVSESRLRYAQLRTRAHALLFHLQKVGADPGAELVLLTDRNEQFVDVFWA